MTGFFLSTALFFVFVHSVIIIFNSDDGAERRIASTVVAQLVTKAIGSASCLLTSLLTSLLPSLLFFFFVAGH